MSDILHILGNGLTYEGQLLHIIINYTLIILTVAPFLLHRDSSNNRKHRGWLESFAIITFFQVVVWFAMNAVGVSLIWCTMAGYIGVCYWRDGLRQEKVTNRWTLVALLSAFAAIIYYAVVFPIITTVAHVVAVLIGIGLYFIMRSIYRNRSTKNT